ncbi:MAG: LysM peptidoglycan-binding domain-containing protein [Polyangiaceae bacterium]
MATRLAWRVAAGWGCAWLFSVSGAVAAEPERGAVDPWSTGSSVDGQTGDAPDVEASGVPAATPLSTRPGEALAEERSWLSRAHLRMPDLPVRWDERVIRYLDYFRDDPRGRKTFASLYRHSGRWREAMRRTLRRNSLPEDLVWVSMIESGFDPEARSPAGATGLWQLMPQTARIYGLTLDRWLDQRMDPPRATEAAAEMFGELHRRFGSWELALAAFNMGCAGLESIVRRFNTNDFWSLARMEGSLPWETTLYVPKILAAAVVAHNLVAFGYGDLATDPPMDVDDVTVAPGTPLALVAQAAGCSLKELRADNPELRASRTPPIEDGDVYSVKVPAGRGPRASEQLAHLRRGVKPLDRVVVRFGATLDEIAASHKTTRETLIDLNGLTPGEAVRGGTVLLVPRVDNPLAGKESPGDSSTSIATRPSVIVPADVFTYPDRKRIFYRVLPGDTLNDIARAVHVTPDELGRWNDLDPGAYLQDGMTLQVFVPRNADLSHVLAVPESDVHVLAVGSDEFFASIEQDKGFKRITVTAKTGDTLESIGRRFSVTPRTMERINRRGRRDALKPGDSVVVYVQSRAAKCGIRGATATRDPSYSGPLPASPIPDLLPTLPPN